jgi:RimJ/RimL family protein N-acetyltransferase
MKPPEVIKTERLRLRRSVLEDAEAIFAEYAQDSEVTTYLTWRPTGNIEDTREHSARNGKGGNATRRHPAPLDDASESKRRTSRLLLLRENEVTNGYG